MLNANLCKKKHEEWLFSAGMSGLLLLTVSNFLDLKFGLECASRMFSGPGRRVFSKEQVYKLAAVFREESVPQRCEEVCQPVSLSLVSLGLEAEQTGSSPLSVSQAAGTAHACLAWIMVDEVFTWPCRASAHLCPQLTGDDAQPGSPKCEC